MIRSFLAVVVLGFLIGRLDLFSQEKSSVPTALPTFSIIAEDIQRGIQTGDVGIFSKHFAKQVYVDLPGQESGYFSDHQLYYILRNFFGSRLTQQFRFSTVDDSETGSYATGSGSFLFKGRREVLQIYVALARLQGRAVITQFNVY